MRKRILSLLLALTLALSAGVFGVIPALAADSCVSVKADAVTTGEVVAGSLLEIKLSDVFEDTDGHTLTYTLTNAAQFSVQTKVKDGSLYVSEKDPGTYTPKVKATCSDGKELTATFTITVKEAPHGLDAQYNYDETPAKEVTVYVTISNDGVPIRGRDGTVLCHKAITVPYFDLGRYNLSEYYRYHTENGEGKYIDENIVERPTGLHLYLYLLERYFIGLPEEQCCKGAYPRDALASFKLGEDVCYMDETPAYTADSFAALTITGSPTSLYMANFWGHDENLMYFVNHEYPLMSQGIGSELAVAGVTMRPCICGPCFGVTDTPANDQLSIRHVTRNYSTREGSKPGQGQMAAVCLMDARSIAATVRNGGRLTAATELTNVEYRNLHHHFNEKIYEHQIYDNYGHADPQVELVKGPNIADWPEMAPLKENILLKVAGSYQGSVTTDELVPSGEASSYRSNPEKISGFTMISRDPQYVPTAKAIRVLEAAPNLEQAPKTSRDAGDPNGVTFGSLMVSDQIGDGSSREQAASCQKVLGGFANLAQEYSTKRYRSNLINWGLLPLRTEEKLQLPVGTYVYIEGIRSLLRSGASEVELNVLDSHIQVEHEADVRALHPAELKAHSVQIIHATLDTLTEEEREILMSGCLINHYKND